jgi:hypothetical protein
MLKVERIELPASRGRLSDINEPELVCPACSEVATAQFAIFNYLTQGKLMQTSDFNYVISKLIRVVLCHEWSLPGNFLQIIRVN